MSGPLLSSGRKQTEKVTRLQTQAISYGKGGHRECMAQRPEGGTEKAEISNQRNRLQGADKPDQGIL